MAPAWLVVAITLLQVSLSQSKTVHVVFGNHLVSQLPPHVRTCCEQRLLVFRCLYHALADFSLELFHAGYR